MIVVACICDARADQPGPEPQAETCWACGGAMVDTGIRWERAGVCAASATDDAPLFDFARAA